MQDLQRHIAYDALLQRLFRQDRNWILKGAVALMARRVSTRSSIDIDLHRRAEPDEMNQALRLAAADDTGDWFRFEIGDSEKVTEIGTNLRVLVNASIGTTPWSQFHVDLAGSNVAMTGEPDETQPLISALPQDEQVTYRVYPIVDHLADKVVATFDRYGLAANPSTRYRDLIDLVAVIGGLTLDAAPVREAIRSEARRRDVELPAEFNAPDRDLWLRGYAQEARRSRFEVAPSLDEALAIVKPCLDPVLDGTAAGRWSPASQRWELDG
jgi:hypothetical protein